LEASQQFSFLQGRVASPVLHPPTWRTTSPYLYPLETGWPSYTPRHRVPILVASYDTHGLRWDYSYSPVTTRARCFESGFLKYHLPSPFYPLSDPTKEIVWNKSFPLHTFSHI
jgi:hypothetical protein